MELHDILLNFIQIHKQLKYFVCLKYKIYLIIFIMNYIIFFLMDQILIGLFEDLKKLIKLIFFLNTIKFYYDQCFIKFIRFLKLFYNFNKEIF